MKISRFVLNSDYATLRSKGTATLTLVLPDTITIPAGSPNAVYTARTTIAGSNSTYFRAIWKNLYYRTGSNVTIAGQQDGNPAQAIGTVYCENGEYVAEITVPGSSFSDTTWTGLGRTYTVQIQTFLDPFAK